jgi:hypothetical protein
MLLKQVQLIVVNGLGGCSEKKRKRKACLDRGKTLLVAFLVV